MACRFAGNKVMSNGSSSYEAFLSLPRRVFLDSIKRLSRVPLVFRVGPANSLVNTIWAQSLDGGLTFPTRLQMSTATSNWCSTVSNITPNFGDYIGATAGGNRILGTWADGRNGAPDTFLAAGLGSGK